MSRFTPTLSMLAAVMSGIPVPRALREEGPLVRAPMPCAPCSDAFVLSPSLKHRLARLDMPLYTVTGRSTPAVETPVDRCDPRVRCACGHDHPVKSLVPYEIAPCCPDDACRCRRFKKPRGLL